MIIVDKKKALEKWQPILRKIYKEDFRDFLFSKEPKISLIEWRT